MSRLDDETQVNRSTFDLLLKKNEELEELVETAKLKEELDRLTSENAALKRAAKPEPRGITVKVSEKGAVSVYGLGRFPVTLYQEQWRKLLEHEEEIRSFIKMNDVRLKKKG